MIGSTGIKGGEFLDAVFEFRNLILKLLDFIIIGVAGDEAIFQSLGRASLDGAKLPADWLVVV